MMRVFPRLVRSRTLRCFTAAALLLYLLIPQAGICRCIRCECCRPVQTEKTESAGKPCCCSSHHNETEPPAEEPAAAETKKPEQHGCPCVLKTLKVAGKMLLSPPVQIQNLPGFPGFPVIAVIGAADIHGVSAYHSFCYEKEYPPPVRLHLYLQVMRN